LTLEPSPANGLRALSQIMADKVVAHPRDKCGAVIGRIEEKALASLDHALAFVLGLSI
jgi:mRNA interferase MazF